MKFIWLILLPPIYSLIQNLGILNTIANRNEYSDYTFLIHSDVPIPPSSYILIVFPSQYISGLGIDQVTTQTCSVNCRITAYNVEFDIDSKIEANTLIEVKINQVLNPDKKGGTGNFQVSFRRGQYVFDQNLIFGTIGISDYIVELNSAIIKCDNSKTATRSNYDFHLKTRDYLPVGTYFVITVPSYYGIGDLEQVCKILPNHPVKCTNSGNVITITEVNRGFQEMEEWTIKIELINPNYAQFTNHFRIVAYRDQTTLAYAWRSSLLGVDISATDIVEAELNTKMDNIKICRNMVMDVILKFKSINGGRVQVEVPQDFYMITNIAYERVRPIGDYVMDDTKIIFDDVIDGGEEQSIDLRIRSKQIGGLSQSFKISILNENGVVDQVSTGLNMEIEDYGTIGPFEGQLTNGYAGQLSTDLKLNFIVTKQVPINGYIRLYFDSDFELGQGFNNKCITNSVGTFSQSCSLIDNYYKMQISNQFDIDIEQEIRLVSLIRTPLINNGYYLIHYYSYMSDDTTIIESATFYVLVQPKQLLSVNVLMIGQELSTNLVDKYSIFDIEFTLLDAPNKEIIFEFGPLLTWKDDLGTSLQNMDIFPCLFIQGITTGQCILQHGSLYTLPIIKLIDFNAINAGDIIQLHLPKIRNPETSPIQITINTLYNFKTTSITLQPNNPIAYATISKQFTFTSQVVSQPFQMDLQAGITQDLNPESYMLLIFPTYDNGFFPSQTLTCNIDAIQFTCYPYNQIGWLLIYIPTPQLVTAASLPNFIIDQLQWPRSAHSYDYFKWISFTPTPFVEQEKKIVQFAPGNTFFPAPSPKQFLTSKPLVYQQGKGYSGQHFSFELKVDIVYQDTELKLTFPAEFNLLSDPLPQCSIQELDFEVLNINKNSIEIKLLSDGFSDKFILDCYGISTPFNPPDNSCDGWNIEISINNYLIYQRNNFMVYDYTNQFIPGLVSISDIHAFPNNPEYTSQYYITFSMETSLSKYASIHITFPSSNYPELPYPPNLATCFLNLSFSSCLLTGSTYVITLDEPYESDRSLTFSIDNIINPSATTDPFIIQTYYDSQVIDTLDQSTLINRTITITTKPLPIQVNYIDFSPLNEALPSIYKFSLSLPIPLTPYNQLVIKFPPTYHYTLGENVLAYYLNQVPITISNRHIYFKKDYYPSNITFELHNIINPNYQINSNTGHFIIGIMSNHQYIACNPQAGVLEMKQSPGWAYLISIQPENLYSRWISTNYVFNFTIFDKIPPLEKMGYLQIDFPKGFQITDKNVTCNYNAQIELTCNISNNVLRAYGNLDYINGQIQFNVGQIENPLDEMEVNGLIIKTYDGFKKTILEQSYPNLDPISFTYRFPGSIIKINDDEKIQLQRGTQSKDLYFTLEYPCALNLTFRHNSELIVTPKEIKLPLISLTSSYRVAVPETLKEGTYFIYWETIGELVPPFYTPVKKSEITVIVNQVMTVKVHDIYPIPVGGNSLTCYLTVENAPVQPFTIQLKATEKTFHLSHSILNFSLGVNTQTYTVYQNVSELQFQQEMGIVTEEEKRIYFSGGNDLYKLDREYVKVEFIASDNQNPQFFKIFQVASTQTTISVKYQISEISRVYWMLALKQSMKPSINELLQSGPPLYLSTESIYGKFECDGNYVLVLDGLKASREYVIYSIAQDREDRLSEIQQLNITTQDRYVTAEAQMIFYTKSLNEAQKQKILEQIAFLLSLPTTKVLEKEDYEENEPISEEGRLLQASEEEAAEEEVVPSEENLMEEESEDWGQGVNPNRDQTSIIVQVVPLDWTENFDEPSEILLRLNSIKKLIQRYVPLYAIEQTISPSEYQGVIPNMKEVKVVEKTRYSCKMNVETEDYGWVFGIGITEDELIGGIPNSFQIFSGLQANNIEVKSFKKQMMRKTDNVTITNLEPGIAYKIYIISGSDQPDYPDIGEESQIIECETETLTASMFQLFNQKLILRRTILNRVWIDLQYFSSSIDNYYYMIQNLNMGK